MGQLRALVGLRWQMVRSPRVRVGLLLLALALPLLVVLAGTAGQVARSASLSFNVLLLSPTLFLGFAVLAVVAPLSSGGGNELFPPEQLVAFPVRPATTYLASLLSAPLNLAWATQVVSLAAATSFIADRGPLVLLSLTTTLAYIALATTAGQAIGWWVVGARQSALGRHLTTGLGIAVLVTAVGVVAAGRTVSLLDRSPTTAVTIAAVQGSQGRLLPWAGTTFVLVVATAVALWSGTRAAGWALRRPSEAVRAISSRRQRRRPSPRGNVRTLLRADRASVWRSTP
ncbi:MAG: hypothetical protein WCD35_18890, partial [Mycobacteriales bacterium]